MVGLQRGFSVEDIGILRVVIVVERALDGLHF